MSRASRPSSLHTQMGQETIYLLLAVTLFTAIILGGVLIARQREAKPREDPPIIVLPEAQGFSFAPGSAALSPDFESRLTRQVIPRVRAIGQAYDAQVIEVIGHTDEVPRNATARRLGNLDAVLVPLFLGKAPADPVAADNAGLGMARAVAVARFMRGAGLEGFTFVPLSAGPFLKPDDSMLTGGEARADPARRRIEVRLRRHQPGGGARS